MQPRWIGIHLAAVVVAVSCFGLGYWQYVRAQEPSREVITNPLQDLDDAARLQTVLQPGDYMPDDDANRAVTARGTYDADARRLAPALSPDGEEGYYVVFPLVTDDGVAVAVNRGWIHAEDVDKVDEMPAPPEGKVTVTGWLRPPQSAEDGYVPLTVPEGQIDRISTAVLVNEWPYRLYEGYLTMAEQDPADPPATSSAPQAEVIPPPSPPKEIIWNWRSLSYAAQWVIFGIAAIVFWVSLMRREVGADRQRGDGSADDGGEAESEAQRSAAAAS
ncbi:SURF1 family protein [Nocardiopsis gilva]|uniref:SURF1 family protein n=1 Tax=Nocardiopsis gilva TaxID=280236 RepID=UPI001F4C80A1|nr:SURF1 family protein [Nocardiopsis gilva]